MIDNISKYVYLALIAEKAGSFDHMKFYLEKHVIDNNGIMSCDERNLLSVAYKNIISEKRQCIRTLITLELKETQNASTSDSFLLDSILSYKKVLEEDLIKTCEYINNFIISFIINADKFNKNDNCGLAFYNKLIADYYRYIAENIECSSKNKYSDKSLEYYNKAREYAKSLNITDPVRLSIALNMSVFYYEIINNHETACIISKEILDLVKKEIDTLDENDESNIDTFNIIDLIQENLNMWNIELEH